MYYYIIYTYNIIILLSLQYNELPPQKSSTVDIILTNNSLLDRKNNIEFALRLSNIIIDRVDYTYIKYWWYRRDRIQAEIDNYT